MGNLNLFDVIQEAAEMSPTLGTEKPEPEDVSIFDGVSPTDFDAQGKPVDPNAPHGTPLTETPPTLADAYAAQENLDPVEEAETYGEAGPPIPEDPDPYFDEGMPDDICACMMVDDWARQEDDDEPGEPPAGNPEQKPQNDSGIRVVRNGTKIQLEDRTHTWHPNWPEIRAKLGVSESPREVKAFFEQTVPNLTDARLIELAGEK